MKNIIGIALGIGILCSTLYTPVLGQTTNTTLIEELEAKIAQLKTQIEQLQLQLKSMRQTEMEILQLTQQLRKGMTGEDVKLLQEVLATDPEIYPEGLVTGFFGVLTSNAVKRLQKLAGLEQVGQVGPKTLSKINELLKEGAGSSGKVPPGLLIAPGIRKKLGGVIPRPLPGQELPSGIEKKLETTTPPAEGINPLIY